MEIVTKRFFLRDFVESDRLPFLNYQADPRNLTFYEPKEASPEQAAHLFDLFQTWASEIPRLNYQLAIAHRQASDNLVGCCGLRGIRNGEMELGIELAPTYWGRYAYAIEVGSALLDFGFSELKLDKISGSTVSANTRIAKLAEWSGAEVVGVSPASHLGWSEVKWVLIKERWKLRNTERLQYNKSRRRTVNRY
jgi:[ribosomal protein S5]-alanine N-acetyltransferase